MTTATIDQLRSAGLLAPSGAHLTDKGKSWLRALEGVKRSETLAQPPDPDDFSYLPQGLEPTLPGAATDDEDFVCSCSGLLR